MMKSRQVIYTAWHTNPLNDDIKIIGYYTIKELAEQALSRAKILPGFRDSPEHLEISDTYLDFDSWTEGFVADIPELHGTRVGLD